MLSFQKQMPSLTLLVAPDHATPVSTKTHGSGPVPFAACGGSIRPGKTTVYSEASAREMPVFSGPEMFERFIRGTLQK
jgi:2,3-bisphosphoglycerate-independent phosphoglycerate mutase